jgi:hypothetical protein
MPEKFDEKVIMVSIIEHATQVQCDIRELRSLRQVVQDELRATARVGGLSHRTTFFLVKYIHEVLKFGAKRSAIIITKRENFAKRGIP